MKRRRRSLYTREPSPNPDALHSNNIRSFNTPHLRPARGGATGEDAGRGCGASSRWCRSRRRCPPPRDRSNQARVLVVLG